MEEHRRSRLNRYGRILCGLVFFALCGTIFCMGVNAREARQEARKAEAVKEVEAEKKKAEKEEKKKEKESDQRADTEDQCVEKEAEEQRKKELSVQPGVAVGTTEASDEKIVYLTFDDGPSENTQKVLDILDQYDAKATFFITGQKPEYRPMIKKAYDAGHTIGLHSFCHDYEIVYSSEEAYLKDLEEVGEIAKEQIGFVPCFIRFPGGSSNTVSRNYMEGIMSVLVPKVLELGYQYYDWNVSSGDGGTATTEEIIAQSETDKYHQVMLLFHDAATKETTIEALPTVLEYYKNLGYSFKAIDRKSLVVHHQVNN